MNLDKLNEYKKSHDSLHRAVGRSEHYISSADDWNKETMQLDIFLNVLGGLGENPVMIELGTSMVPAYSKAFTDVHSDGLSICTEPRLHSLNTAKKILPNSKWHQCYTGTPKHVADLLPTKEEIVGTSSMSIKEIMNLHNVAYVDILHMDIQGSEVEAIKESIDVFDRIGYCFVALHNTYNEVMPFFKDGDFNIIFSDPTKGGYGDGLIVARKKQ